MFTRNCRLRSRLSRAESGQALVETALCASIFILLMFAIIDFGFLYYSKVTIQNAVRQAGRYAITGNCQSGTCFDPKNGAGDRLNTIIKTVQNFSFGLNPTVSVTCISGTCPAYAGFGSNNAGGPGDVVEITATYTFTPIMIWRFIGGTYTYTVRSVFKNEIFQPPAS